MERQREREIQIAAQLSAEQTKLTELEGRLDVLEREIDDELERQRTEVASKTEKRLR